MYEGERLITPETQALLRSSEQLESRQGQKWESDSGEGLRFAYSAIPLPQRIETAHFEAGIGEVAAPDPEETFAMPFEGPARWVKAIVARRRNGQ